MNESDRIRICDLIDRLARISAAEGWSEDLNPAQRSALSYLARANQFSRSPSQISDYLGTTRGTASQTLKVLERKGMIRAVPSQVDRRSLSYELTEEGTNAARHSGTFESVLETLDPSDAKNLETTLSLTLRRILARTGGRTFGVCKTCKHHRMTDNGSRCNLLGVPINEDETHAICHEHTA